MRESGIFRNAIFIFRDFDNNLHTDVTKLGNLRETGWINTRGSRILCGKKSNGSGARACRGKNGKGRHGGLERGLWVSPRIRRTVYCLPGGGGRNLGGHSIISRSNAKSGHDDRCLMRVAWLSASSRELFSDGNGRAGAKNTRHANSGLTSTPVENGNVCDASGDGRLRPRARSRGEAARKRPININNIGRTGGAVKSRPREKNMRHAPCHKDRFQRPRILVFPIFYALLAAPPIIYPPPLRASTA